MATRYISDKWPEEIKKMVASMDDEEYSQWLQELKAAMADREIKDSWSQKTKESILSMSSEDYERFKKDFQRTKYTEASEEEIERWLKRNQAPTKEIIDQIINQIM